MPTRSRETLRIDGYRQLMAALQASDKASRKQVRDELRVAGDVVRQSAAARFAATDRKSAAGYRTRVRQTGVVVEQSLRKTTGQHPRYGGMQMRRALLPAMVDEQPKLERALEDALDRICDRFNAG